MLSGSRHVTIRQAAPSFRKDLAEFTSPGFLRLRPYKLDFLLQVEFQTTPSKAKSTGGMHSLPHVFLRLLFEADH